MLYPPWNQQLAPKVSLLGASLAYFWGKLAVRNQTNPLSSRDTFFSPHLSLKACKIANDMSSDQSLGEICCIFTGFLWFFQTTQLRRDCKKPWKIGSLRTNQHIMKEIMSFSGFSLSVARMFFPIKFVWSQGNQNTWVFSLKPMGLWCRSLTRICSGVFLQPPLAPFPRGIALRPGEYSDSVVNFICVTKNPAKKLWGLQMVEVGTVDGFFFEILHRPNYQAKNLVIAGFRKKTHRFSRYWLHSTEPNPITLAKVEVLGIRDGGDSWWGFFGSKVLGVFSQKWLERLGCAIDLLGGSW